MDESKLAQEVDRGRKASVLLSDTIFREAIEITQQRILDDFARCEPSNALELQKIRLKLQCHADLLREISEVIRTGQLAQVQVTEARSLFDRMRRVRS